MKKLIIAAGLLALSTTACKGTGKEGEYEVEKPVVGTTTDTVHTPTVGMDTATVKVPTVGTEEKKIEVPTIKKPQ